MLQVLGQLLCVPPCHLVTSNEKFQQQMCASGVDCELAVLSCYRPFSGCKVLPVSMVMSTRDLASTMTQQDQEGGHSGHCMRG